LRSDPERTPLELSESPVTGTPEFTSPLRQETGWNSTWGPG
jgi:hypothetical protein